MVHVLLFKSEEIGTVSVAAVKPKTWFGFVASNKVVSKKIKVKLLKSFSDQLVLLVSDALFQRWPVLNWIFHYSHNKNYLVYQIKVALFAFWWICCLFKSFIIFFKLSDKVKVYSPKLLLLYVE